LLNRVLADAFSQQPAAIRSGKRFKVLYATVPEPRRDIPIPIPEIVIFCNHYKYLDEHYKRYLEARIREHIPYTGLPIEFRFRGREERGKK
jgi:GTP-binding protein